MFNISEKDLHIIQEEMAPGTLRSLEEKLLELAMENNPKEFLVSLEIIRDYVRIELSGVNMKNVFEVIETLQALIEPAILIAEERVAKQSIKKPSSVPYEQKPLSDKEKAQLKARQEQSRIERELQEAIEKETRKQQKSEAVERVPIDLVKIESLTDGPQLNKEQIINILGGFEQIVYALSEIEEFNKRISLISMGIEELLSLTWNKEITYENLNFKVIDRSLLKTDYPDKVFDEISGTVELLNTSQLPVLIKIISDFLSAGLKNKYGKLNSSINKNIKLVSEQLCDSIIKSIISKSDKDKSLLKFFDYDHFKNYLFKVTLRILKKI
jgi:hypothetical protein